MPENNPQGTPHWTTPYLDPGGATLALTNRELEGKNRALDDLNINLEQKVESRTEELYAAKNQAESANRAKSVFLANMSHELRTPLNAVLGFADIMARDSKTSPNQRENLSVISHSGHHLLTLINDILDMSKIEAGRMSLEREDTDFHQMIRGITAMINLQAEQKGLTFHLNHNTGTRQVMSRWCFPEGQGALHGW